MIQVLSTMEEMSKAYRKQHDGSNEKGRKITHAKYPLYRQVRGPDPRKTV